MSHRHLQRGYTEADWLGAQGDPVLEERELAFVTDTGEHVLGDGVTAFSGLTRHGGSGASALVQMLPAATTKGTALTTSLAAVGASWVVLDTAQLPAGQSYEYRAVVVFSGANSSDVLGARLYDSIGAAVVLAEFTHAAATNGGEQSESAWTAMPATVKRCYFEVRNQTAARGVVQHAWVEVRAV